MQTVWKYEIKGGDYFTLELPRGAKPLTVQEQHDNVYLWCLVNSNEKITEKRIFRLAGTGHPIKDTHYRMDYIGTFQLLDGDLIFHLFECK